MPALYLVSSFLRGVLVGVSPWDPTTLVLVSSGLVVAAMIACYLPARRVLRIQPSTSLR